MIAGVVLAAGLSSRLGRPKMLLSYRGRPLLEHVIQAMQDARVGGAGVHDACIEAVYVVLGHEAEKVQREVSLGHVRVIFNPEYADGLSGSLRAGIAGLGPEIEAALCVVGDQPLIDSALLESLCEAYHRRGGPLVATDYGTHLGTPLVIPRALWGEVGQMRGDVGARPLLQRHAATLVSVRARSGQGIDIDLWDDYAALIKGG